MDYLLSDFMSGANVIFFFKLTNNIAIFLSFQKQMKVKIYLANTYKYIIYHTQFTYGVAAP